jgi:phage terminase Nu1 subunit (DNA packaging protein)
MADDTTTEMVNPEQSSPVEGQAETQTSTEMVQVSASELADIRAALKKANAEAAKYRKTAEAAESERKAKEEAEMTELQKWQRKAQELEQAVASERRTRLQTEIAAKVGLPAKLASRLHGETAEEMEADAKEILETLPKPPPQAKPSPGIVTNPGANATTQETEAQLKARLFPTYNPFDPAVAKQLGGGVFFLDKD